MGSVKVEGWDKNEVRVTGTLGEGPERLDVEKVGDHVRIEVVWPRRNERHWNKWDGAEGTDLEVMVPRGSEIQVEGVNTEIEIKRVENEVWAESVNGSIVVDGSPEEVSASTVNGNVDITASANEVEAETVNGRITISGSRGDVVAGTVNGSIEVSGAEFESAEFSSVSGDIEFRGALSRRGSIQFESHSGSVILYLPSDVSAEFEVSTFSGKIVNELGPEARRTSKYAPGYELEFTTGSGDAEVEISSFSGRVEIKKGK
jgi:DUF4097 and DUF4098 domain-containing protein YvlB